MPRCLNQPGTSKRQCFTEPTLRERSNWIEKTAVTRLIVFRLWESRIHVPTDLRESSCRRHHGQHPRTSPTDSLHPYQHLGRQHSQSSGCPQSLSSLFPLGHSLADQSLSHRTAHSITCVIHSTWLSTSAWWMLARRTGRPRYGWARRGSPSMMISGKGSLGSRRRDWKRG